MKQFRSVLRIEVHKAVFSKYFAAGTALLLLFSVLSAVYMIQNYGGYNPDEVIASMEDGKYLTNPSLPLYSFYNSWLGGDDLSLASTLYYVLLPIGAALPFSWSFCVERKSGYLKNVYTRVDKRIYLCGKTIAAFLSGATAVFISLLVNLLLVAARIPFVTPFAGYTFYNHIQFGELWSDLYFVNPFCFVILYVLLTILYGGLFSLVSFSLGFYFRNVFVVVLLPFLFMLAAVYMENMICVNMQILWPMEFVPTAFLHVQGIHSFIRPWGVLLTTIVMLLFALLTISVRGTKDEIF